MGATPVCTAKTQSHPCFRWVKSVVLTGPGQHSDFHNARIADEKWEAGDRRNVPIASVS
jgi:hypothetical protein